MYKVKCNAILLDIIDLQNTHSITMELKGVVKLLRFVGRKKELYREILAFSILYSDRVVKIYGHYPMIINKNNTYYRHLIYIYDFKVIEDKVKYIIYKFIKNLYDI